jgi:hypothetical protein
VKFKEAVFVLHCFQKKSKRGIATPKGDIDIIRSRLKVAEALAKELRNETLAATQTPRVVATPNSSTLSERRGS